MVAAAGLAQAAGVTRTIDVTPASVNIAVTITIPAGTTSGGGSAHVCQILSSNEFSPDPRGL